MIVLDTNVVFEALKPGARTVVMAWLDDQAAETLFVTSVTRAELLFGIARLPSGRRKGALTSTLDGLLATFGPRMLPFDREAACAYAEIAALARQGGQGLSVSDGFIAATAASRGFSIATRDTAPFVAAGVPVIDPWRAH